MSAAACSACYGSGYGVDGNPCPCGCRPARANAGPPPGDYPMDRAIKAMPLPQFPIATPVAAGSVDTMKRYSFEETSDYVQGQLVAFNDFIEAADGEWVKHADAIAWGAQQREAGKSEALGLKVIVAQLRERAEKAEAEGDVLFRRLNVAREQRTIAEARVKELEAQLEFDRSPSRIDDLQYVLRCAGSIDLSNCDCHSCQPITMANNRMIVCATCGNKRCPHANDHRNACTGSNDPGQAGSAYA